MKLDEAIVFDGISSALVPEFATRRTSRFPKL
jgi:hypothetical protein